MSLKIEKIPFGSMPDGRTVYKFRMTNESGAVAEVCNYGATLVNVKVPDKTNKLVSVVKGFPSVNGYLADRTFGTYLGATCGRYANRIAKARFVLEGREYILAANNGDNSLHGGIEAFHTKYWDFEVDEEYVHFSCESQEGEEGFPGKLKVRTSYGWSATNELSILYSATTDKATPLNLTSHAYFNLAGGGNILTHRMKFHADRFIPILPDAIPTGEIRLVKDTAFDFSEFKAIGKDIDKQESQLINGAGYDHCFVINKEEYGSLALAVEVFAPETGCGLKVWTSKPGIQFYSGNYLRSELPASDGKPLAYREAFCLEPEFFPDSPNQSGFPDCILQAGQTYNHSTIFQFYVED